MNDTTTADGQHESETTPVNIDEIRVHIELLTFPGMFHWVL